MAQKIRDVAVKTGTYMKDGQEKGRWQNVGALMKGDDGGEFIILHRWFNPAGVPNPEDRDSVVLSCFRSDRDGQQGQSQQQRPPWDGAQQQSQQPQGGVASSGNWDDSDSIPF